MLHLAPSTSFKHSELLKLVEIENFDPDVLRNFFWLINAHDRLIAFPRICTNVINIIDEAKTTWGDDTAPLCMEAAIPLLRWISEHGASLTAMSPEFNQQPRNNKDHPVMGKGSSRHPLYTTLWNTCETPELTHKYLLLQAHLLFAHANQVETNTTREYYEQYAGQREWKGLPNSPYSACLTVRELSEARSANILVALKTELPTIEFSESFNKLPSIHEVSQIRRLDALRDFLQKSSGLKNWVKRSGSNSHSSEGGSARVTGFVEISPGVVTQDLQVSDPDDPDQDWGKQSMVINLNLTTDEQKNLLEYDLAPEEFDTQEMLLSGYDSPMTGTLAANGAAQLRHVAMANQLFPWSFGQLTLSDFGPALVQVATWVKDRFVDNQGSARGQDWEKLEAFILLRIMIFTGSSFDRARKILALPASNPNEDAELTFLKLPDESHAFRVKALQPDYKTRTPTTDGSERPRTDYILLPDISNAHAYIDLLRQKPHSAAQKDTDFRLFRRKPETLKSNLMKLLKEQDPTGRLTPHKASIFLQNRVLQVTEGDICAASLICGELHPLARVRLFYSVLSAEALQEIYIKATKDLVDQVLQAGNKNRQAQPPGVQPAPRFVGSRFCPTLDAVKNAVSSLKSDLQSASSTPGSHEVHNLYTLLTVWHFTFSTACRAIETPYLPLSDIDPQSGIGLFADKDDGTGYKARLIWVPPSILDLMHAYEMHRAALLEARETPEPIFFLLPGRKGMVQAMAVRPKTTTSIMQKYLAYPVNFHRRFMRTELLARGCPTEVVDAWMGHWHFGEEPWGLYSSFSFQEYRAALQTHLIPLLDELGFNGTILPTDLTPA